MSIPGAQPIARPQLARCPPVALPHQVLGVQGLRALHAAPRLLVKHFQPQFQKRPLDLLNLPSTQILVALFIFFVIGLQAIDEVLE